MNSLLRTILAAAFLLATPLMAVEAGGDAHPASGAPTLFILVRHAEKMAGGPDPTLSSVGEQRASELARVLADVPIDALYASQFTRAQRTLEPLAAEKDLTVETDRIEGKVEDWARNFAVRLLERHRGQTIVIAGHSNTTPLLARALGATAAPNLSEADYDDLFWIVRTNEHAELVHLHYGTATE